MQTKTNDGSVLQDKLAQSLREFVTWFPATWYRFPDTKSARVQYMQSQPGDYLLVTAPAALLIECKSTTTGISVITMAFHGNTGRNQVAKHRLWHRAGHPSVYLWAELEQQRFEWHWGHNVVKKIHFPFLVGPLKQLGDSLPDLAHAVLTEKRDATFV